MKQGLAWGFVSGALLAIGIGVLPILAQSARYQLSGTRVFLSPRQQSATITITNTGDVPVDFEVSLQQWRQMADGRDELTPAPPNSPELVVFPLILKIPPREARNIRLSRRVPPTATEVSYRLFIAELPPPNVQQTEQLQIRFVTQHSLPVFIEPATVQRRGEFVEPRVQQGQLAFGLRNTGNVHLQTLGIRVVGVNSEGRSIFEKKLDSVYILPGVTRSFTAVALPQDNCGAVQRLDIRLENSAIPLSTSVPTPGGVCR
ncbi:fimbria/pilus periplasmic chaperone [Thermosynechococcaceae cyanobacterium Okahandja]